MIKIILSVTVVAAILIGTGAAYVLFTTKTPEPQAVVKEIPYESIVSKN